MVYLGVNSNNGGASSTAASSSAGQNKNGSRSPHDIVDLDTEKANERNGGKKQNYYLLIFPIAPLNPTPVYFNLKSMS